MKVLIIKQIIKKKEFGKPKMIQTKILIEIFKRIIKNNTKRMIKEINIKKKDKISLKNKTIKENIKF